MSNSLLFRSHNRAKVEEGVERLALQSSPDQEDSKRSRPSSSVSFITTMCLTYFCCCRPCCCPEKKKPDALLTEEEQRIEELKQQALEKPLTEEEEKDFDNLVYIAQKRDIRVTVQKGTQAGLAAGLMVMGGVIVAGPVGAVVGGAAGTAIAASLSHGVVSLNDLLVQTPPTKRAAVYRVFSDAMKEEFQDGFTQNPELRLLMSGGSIIGVTRYALDRDLIESEKLEKLDLILKKIK